MINYMKFSRLHVTRYICGNPLLSNNKLISLDKEGFPTRLLFLKPLCKGSKTDMRVAMTLLLLTRGLKPTKKEDKVIMFKTNSITDNFSGKSRGTIPTWFIKKWVIDNNFVLEKPVYSLDNHYLSMRGGPSGKSTWASQWSHLFYKQDLIISIMNIMKEGFKDLFHTPFIKNMELSYGKDRWPNGKLSIVKDPECKRRVIAMVDYHSQLALKPIHDDLLNLLKRLPCDRTFTQDPKHNWANSNEYFYSLDLSSATDRFPIDLQKRLLTEIYQDSNFSESWSTLLINRDYRHPDGKTDLRYAVGQPMGAYSSWAAFTLTHHLLMAWCAYKAHKTMSFNQYIILGDDVVIKDNKVASIYRGQMMRLGVEVSLPKTHVSKTTYEFAKRWINNGIEISGLPLRGIFTHYNNLRIIYSEILNYVIKVPLTNSLSSFDIFTKVLNGLPLINKKGKTIRFYSLSYLMRYKNFAESIRYSLGVLTPFELRNIIGRYKTKDIDGNFDTIPNEDQILNYIKGILINGLADSILNTLKDLINQIEKFELLPPLERKSLVYSGVLYGMRNRISHLIEVSKEWENDSISIYEVINHFSVTSPDKLSRSDRDINQRLLFLDTLWTKSLKKHFSSQRFPDSYYIERYGSKRLMGSLDSLDITNYKIKVNPIWNRELKQFADRSRSSIEFFISKNI